MLEISETGEVSAAGLSIRLTNRSTWLPMQLHSGHHHPMGASLLDGAYTAEPAVCEDV